MSRKKGLVFSAEQKTKIVLELLREEQTIAQLATKYAVTAKSIHNWKAQFLANASLAIEPAKVVSEYKEELKAKEDEITQLQKALGKATIRADWAEGKLKSLDYKTRKALIKSELYISIADQCEILGVSRSNLYYQPKEVSREAIMIMHTIDEIYTDSSEYGYRQIHQQLTQEYGFHIGKERVLKYMNTMGIQAIHPRKKKLTSIKDLEHKVYPYLLKEYWSKREDRTKSVYVPNANEVWSGDITYIRMNGGLNRPHLSRQPLH
jgi:putative transposase